MRLSRPSLIPVCSRLSLTMSLLLLTGLAGCGPASSDNAPTLGSSASQGEPSFSHKNPSLGTDPFASVASSATASPAPFALENGTGSVPEKGKVPAGDSPKAAPTTTSTKQPNPMADLVVPAWFAKDLASPDVDTRLRALDTWLLTASGGSLDPLILAFENDEERVRARAMELIQQE
jgi:hypothetical protein